MSEILAMFTCQSSNQFVLLDIFRAVYHESKAAEGGLGWGKPHGVWGRSPPEAEEFSKLLQANFTHFLVVFHRFSPI